MNKYCRILYVIYSSSLYCITPSIHELSHHAITYEFNPGGRFGDQMLTLIKALYTSHLYNLPLLFKSFDYANQLQIAQREKSFNDYKKYFKKIVPITDHTLLKKTFNDTTLFVTDLKFKDNTIQGFTDLYRYIQTNPAFKQKLITLLQPIQSLVTFDLPTDKITVAVHVRKGGGFDLPLLNEHQSQTHRKYPSYINYLADRYQQRFADKQYPTRFPPEHFYINQLKRLAKLLRNKPLWVRIYTDDKNPKAIVDRFKKALTKYNITFSYRETGNNHTSNVLEDFFTMQQCDCLIRPASSYSKAAQLLGNHKIIIYLQKANWHHHNLVIRKVGIIHNDGTSITMYSE